MTQLNIALALMGGVAVCIALLSAQIKRSPVSEPALAVLVGVAVGPYGLSWLDLARWGDTFSILEQAARLTLAIGLMGVALRLRPAALNVVFTPITALARAGHPWVAAGAHYTTSRTEPETREADPYGRAD